MNNLFDNPRFLRIAKTIIMMFLIVLMWAVSNYLSGIKPVCNLLLGFSLITSCFSMFDRASRRTGMKHSLFIALLLVIVNDSWDTFNMMSPKWFFFTLFPGLSNQPPLLCLTYIGLVCLGVVVLYWALRTMYSGIKTANTASPASPGTGDAEHPHRPGSRRSDDETSIDAKFSRFLLAVFISTVVIVLVLLVLVYLVHGKSVYEAAKLLAVLLFFLAATLIGVLCIIRFMYRVFFSIQSFKKAYADAQHQEGAPPIKDEFFSDIVRIIVFIITFSVFVALLSEKGVSWFSWLGTLYEKINSVQFISYPLSVLLLISVSAVFTHITIRLFYFLYNLPDGIPEGVSNFLSEIAHSIYSIVFSIIRIPLETIRFSLSLLEIVPDYIQNIGDIVKNSIVIESSEDDPDLEDEDKNL